MTPPGLAGWFRDRSLLTKTVLPATLVLTAGVVGLLVYLNGSVQRITINQAVRNAQDLIREYQTLRAYYTANVVEKVKKGTDLKVSYDHRGRDDTIPLPATLIHDLSEQFVKDDNGLQLRLYSVYPFPNRKDRVLDGFARAALVALDARPGEAFTRVEDHDGEKVVRVAVADRMSVPACVQCHNSHPQSPKTDWRLGEARGALEVRIPLTEPLRRSAATARTASLLAGSVFLACLGTITLVSLRSTRRLRRAVGVLEAVARGDLQQKLDDPSRDEIGRLSSAMDEATRELLRAGEERNRRHAEARERERSERDRQTREELWGKQEELQAKVDLLLGNVEAASRGDLTQEVAVRGEDAIGQMGTGLGRFLRDLCRSVAAIAETAHTLASASEELTAVSTQMTSNAEETAAQAGGAAAEQVNRNVQTVAAGVAEMAVSIKEIARNAAEAARMGGQGVKVAEATNRAVAKLEESSAEIGQVIKVITAIAEQTNLLALNASIEAARAGEAGKGFAVVANEVKELAKETANATEDIGAKIGAIRVETGGAMQAIRQVGALIHQINEIQSAIAGAVEEQTATTSEMSRHVDEAARGSQAIAENITAVARAAAETREGAAHSLTASDELARLATDLQELVGQFRYERDGRAGVARPRPAGRAARVAR